MRSSFSGGTPDSSVSEGDGSFRLHDRKPSAPARTMTPGGNYSSWLFVLTQMLTGMSSGGSSGSRPPSRNAESKHGSMQSLDSCGMVILFKWKKKLLYVSWPSFFPIFADGSTHKTSTSSVRRTPSFQRSTLNRPGSSNTLPRKGSAAQSTESPGATSSGTRNRNPSGSSASGMSSSPSVGLNGSSSANR